MRRPQFTLRALLLAMLVVGAFFGGVHWGVHIGRQRQKDDDALAAERAELLARIGSFQIHLDGELLQHLRQAAEMQKLSDEAAE